MTRQKNNPPVIERQFKSKPKSWQTNLFFFQGFQRRSKKFSAAQEDLVLYHQIATQKILPVLSLESKIRGALNT